MTPRHTEGATEAERERYCNKCGYFGPDQIHDRPNGSGPCGYLACVRPTPPAPNQGAES
ncbi:hypothetical protein J2X90_000729 [Variovorax paradoxus]|nr:hypothetical protein [Variovorax paradoxus]